MTNFPKLKKDRNQQIQEAVRNPRKQLTPRHTMVELQENRNKNKVLKA